MNDPATQPIDVEEQRKWLIDFRTQQSLSWSEVSKRVGVPAGTLSQFGGEKGYSGDETKLAQKVYAYRQLIAAQAALAVDAPEAPGYFETPTSRQLGHTLAMAQRGRIVVAAMGPGLGKTFTARHFQSCFPNVFLCTMRKLEELGAITLRDADLPGLGRVLIATLTRSGRDHVERRSELAGVSRPTGS